jgi:hypothetical protein
MAGKENRVFDREKGTLSHVHHFLDSLDCPNFRYCDVLLCYSELIGKQWALGTDSSERAPPIPSSKAAKEVAGNKKSIFIDPGSEEWDDLSEETSESEEQAEEVEEEKVQKQKNKNKGKQKDKKTSKPWKGKFRLWTQEETEALRHGLDLFGWGSWKSIQKNHALLCKRDYRSIITRAKWLQAKNDPAILAILKQNGSKKKKR